MGILGPVIFVYYYSKLCY